MRQTSAHQQPLLSVSPPSPYSASVPLPSSSQTVNTTLPLRIHQPNALGKLLHPLVLCHSSGAAGAQLGPSLLRPGSDSADGDCSEGWGLDKTPSVTQGLVLEEEWKSEEEASSDEVSQTKRTQEADFSL